MLGFVLSRTDHDREALRRSLADCFEEPDTRRGAASETEVTAELESIRASAHCAENGRHRRESGAERLWRCTYAMADSTESTQTSIVIRSVAGDVLYDLNSVQHVRLLQSCDLRCCHLSRIVASEMHCSEGGR